MSMTEEEARRVILAMEETRIEADHMSGDQEFFCCPASKGEGFTTACLDGDFTADQLEAIAVMMRVFQSKAVGVE